MTRGTAKNKIVIGSNIETGYNISSTKSLFFNQKGASMKKEDKKKKFVRYREGSEMYSMSLRKFQDLAKDAGAIYKVGKMVLVNCEIFDRYMETFRL